MGTAPAMAKQERRQAGTGVRCKDVLKPGDIAPEIDAIASDGKRFRLNVGQTASATPNP